MKLFPDKSLGFRLLSASIFIIVVVLSIHTLYAMFHEERRVRDELTSKGELLASLLSYSSRVGVFAENRDLLKDVAAGIVAEPDVVLVGIYNADLKQLYVVNKASTDKDASPGIEAMDAAVKPGRDEITTRDTGRTLEFAKPVILRLYSNKEQTLYFNDQEAGARARIIGYVRIVLGKEAQNRELLGILRRNAVITLIFVALSVAAVFLTVGRITRPLETLTQHVKALGKGGEVGQVPVETQDEIGKLATAFNSMLDERRAAEHAFQKILMDIHDGIGGITTNICLLAEVAQKAPSPAEANDALATILNLSREGMGEIRSLMRSLDSKDLSWHVLIAELRSQGTTMLGPHKIAFDMVSELEEGIGVPGGILCLNLFRIYREALTNIIKHSKAKHVNVGLRVGRGRLLLAVRDDGQGCNGALAAGKGRGLANMKARAAEIGGTVAFTADKGACVSVEIPLSPQSSARVIEPR